MLVRSCYLMKILRVLF